MGTRNFVELFSGGGMARLGLGEGWRCALACDIDQAKAATYHANFGSGELRECDVRNLSAADIDGRPDLIWASFPCQDLSAAGARGGLDGGRSGALWPALELVRRLREQRRAPRLVALENVLGLLTSHKGGDIAAILGTLGDLGYRFGALVVDARYWVPQSRPRLVVIASAADLPLPEGLVSPGPVVPWHTKGIVAAADRLPSSLRGRWTWWSPPAPPHRHGTVADVLEAEPHGVRWHSARETDALLALMGRRDAEKVGHGVVGLVTRRMRRGDGGGMVQRAELRIDGLSGCLRTPAGGSSQQILLVADGDGVRTRQLSARETARLMGLPNSYRLPRKRDEALRLLGDGVVPQMVRYLSATLLEPLLDAMDADEAASMLRRRPGIKGATRGTTVYLLPDEHRRVRRLAIDLDLSVHELILRSLDRMLAEHGQRPVKRYAPEA